MFEVSGGPSLTKHAVNMATDGMIEGMYVWTQCGRKLNRQRQDSNKVLKT